MWAIVESEGLIQVCGGLLGLIFVLLLLGRVDGMVAGGGLKHVLTCQGLM